MTKKKQATPTPTTFAPPQLNDFLIHNFCIGRETTSNGALKLISYGDWGLAIYRTPIGVKFGVHSSEDFITQFLNEDYLREDEREVYESIDLMTMLEIMPIELEELKSAKSKIKTFEGLPEKFGKCIRTCCNGNSKCFVGIANAHVYCFDYGTS